MNVPRSADEIFNDALDLKPAERAAFLARVCDGNDDLRQRVEVLLQADDRAGAFLRPGQLDGAQSAPTIVEPTTTIVSLHPGLVLSDRYRIESLLGRGGMGEVWRAFDLKLRVDVALKALRPELFANDRARELLRREVRTAREVISPNVCRVFDLVVESDQELVSMEYVDGRTLSQLLEEQGPLDPREARDLASQLLAGLEAIHAAGLVHRDMKPENVMITRTGRVVVMDFGIAKGLADIKGTAVAGTPAYMAPEQARGSEVDVRADIFAVGILLAEMISTRGTRDREAREALFASIRKNPPQLPESPWSGVLHRAVAWDPNDRYPSARALARALEEVTLRVAGDDDRSPYPGLASFTESEAEYFFGREAEVEELWKKLQRLHLMAVIGPSGVGKSSFLRAGALAAAPGDWKCIVCAPGNSPFTSVAQALVQEFAGDAEAIHQLLNLSDSHAAGRVFGQWRGRHGQVLLVVDQFEELFTLNPESVQEQFTTFLRALAVDHDVHVLLSMRDDFLFRCHAMSALAPIFSELTPMGPLTGAALRRALVQPALACGYRFEDEALVDEMMQALQSERGALPLLAFAAARLWEKRNRVTGVLERESYREIGGVAGALAQHAEATLERIGTERIPVVREIFRNLVTSQNTRAVQSIEELLSVFEDRSEAEGVLQELIAARLLTSFEAPGTDGEEGENTRRVELIHESLLSAWPRLVRWQSQDADSSRLRDQLRQAAQLWQERGKLDDMLWTGTAYQEFELWRDHYPGGLTSTEEDFARAMHVRVAQQRRRRRIAVGASFVALLAVLAVVGGFWIQARNRARQLEARRLWTKAVQSPADDRTAALAYSTASLELVDEPRVRLIALDALWRSPQYFVVPKQGREPRSPTRFTPDGQWLASGDIDDGVTLWPSDGGSPKVLSWSQGTFHIDISIDGTLLVGSALGTPHQVGLWQIETGTLLHTWDFENITTAHLGDGRLITATFGPGEDWRNRVWPLWRSWPLQDEGAPLILGKANTSQTPQRFYDVSPGARWLVDSKDKDLHLFSLEDLGTEAPILVQSHDTQVRAVGISRSGNFVGSSDEDGDISVWSLEPEPRLIFEAPGKQSFFLDLAMDGSFATVHGDRLQLFRLNGPPGAWPLNLPAFGGGYIGSADFDPAGSWLAIARFMGGEGGRYVSFYPLNARFPFVFPGRGAGDGFDAEFAHDGRQFVRAHGSDVRVCSVPPDDQSEPYQVIYHQSDGRPLFSVDLDYQGERVVVGSFTDDTVHVVATDGREVIPLEGATSPVNATAFSPSGRFVAAVGSAGGDQGWGSGDLCIWDLESGERQTLDYSHGKGIWEIRFLDEVRLLMAGSSGLELWSLDDGVQRVLSSKAAGQIQRGLAVTPDGRYIGYAGVENLEIIDLETGTTRQFDLEDWDISSVSFHPQFDFVALGTNDGVVLVQYLDQSKPHVMLRHRGGINRVHVDADNEWIVTAGPSEMRLWPVPTGEPLYSRPLDEFLEIMRAQTNVGVVPIPEVPGEYEIDIVRPWQGWNSVPTWQ